MTEAGGGHQEELARLRRRLEREHKARREAEAIAERTLGELYDKQQALLAEMKERQRLEEQFRQAQKMEAVGRLAGGVAHDFNNLLTVIIGSSEIILYTLRQNDPSRGLIEEVKKAGERAAALTRQLLAFSRKQVLAPVVLNLNAVVHDIEKMLRRLVGEDIRLTLGLTSAPRPVKADPGQIDQVLMNLVVNSRDAMPAGGTLLIETKNFDLDETFAQSHPEVRPGPYVMLAVSDTGCGMDENTKARLFEPFFTTKGLAKGTGLGLATVYGIVKQSGGFIYVYSEPGRGTTFKIYLPQAEDTRPVPALPPGEARAQGGPETILLVEDETGVRVMVRRALQAKGYNVLEANTAEEALCLAGQFQEAIQLLVTDVILPGMNGRLLADQLTSQRPSLKVLFVSGYTDDAIVQHRILESGTAFLQKPFTPESLARKVRAVLDASE